jgi:hypothetical protein
MKEESCIVIEKVAYGMTIGDLKFGNVRPGVVEATLKPGHTLEDALDELDDRLNAWHRKKYPHLYQQESSPEIVRSFTPQQTGPSVMPQVIDYKQKETLEIAIDNATSLSQLAEIKDKCWKHDLSHQYIIKFNELNNGSTGSFTEGLG